MVYFSESPSIQKVSLSVFSLNSTASRKMTNLIYTSWIVSSVINKFERIRKIVTAITVVPKEAWVPFGFNCWQSSLPSSEEIFITGNSLCSALWKSKSLLSHWLPATQILRLSNLIHVPLFKLLSILHVHSWHSDLLMRLWGPWSLNFLCFSLSSPTSPLWKHSVLF